MRPGFPVWLLLLSACGPGAFAPPPGHAVVVVTNAKGEPIANASTWWLPAGAMANREWLLGCDGSFRDNSFEVLRRHGHARASDENGLVAAPPGAWIAAMSDGLAGVAQVPDPLAATTDPVPLAIDDWQWVVRTIDHNGAPLANVPIAARPSFAEADVDFLGHVMLGQTDAVGKLVVRALGSFDFEAERRERAKEAGESHVESPSAIVVAQGVGFREQQPIRLTSRRSAEVTLTLSHLQRIEFTTPKDLWPRGFDASTRHEQGVATEVAGKVVIYTLPASSMDLMGPQWIWRQPALGVPGQPVGDGVFQVTLPMPPQVATVRVRLLADDGAAADRCSFRLEQQHRAWSQPDGTILVWLNTEKPMPSTMRVEVISSVAPERIGQHTTLVLPKLTAGQRVDLGTLTLSLP